jgi:uncharacterized protein
MRISGVTYVSKKKRKSNSVILIFVYLILILFIIVSLLSLYMALGIIHPEKKAIEPFSSNIIPDYRDIAFFDIEKEITLKGWYFKAGNSKNTVIFAHGYGENRLQFGNKTPDMIKTYLQNNYNVLTFDFRNSGNSEGNITTMGYNEVNDLLGAIRYVKSSLGAENIILFGFSTGATSCLLTCEKSSDITAVIADTPYMNIESFVDDSLYMKELNLNLPEFIFKKTTSKALELITNINYSKYDVSNNLSSVKMPPVMLIHASDDTIVPVSGSSRFYSLISRNGNNNIIWIVENSSHLESYNKYTDVYIQKTLDFIKNTIND